MGGTVRLAFRAVLQRDQVAVHPVLPADACKGT